MNTSNSLSFLLAYTSFIMLIETESENFQEEISG